MTCIKGYPSYCSSNLFHGCQVIFKKGYRIACTLTNTCLYSYLKSYCVALYHQLRDQCYDGASNMAGIKSGVATVLQKEEPRAILTHCYGRSLQLAVSDTVKQVKLMQDTLDVTLEISKLLKYSPKRHTLFNKLKDELAPEKPGF